MIGGVANVTTLADSDPGNAATYAAALELSADCMTGWAVRVGRFEDMDKAHDFGVIGFEHGSMQERPDVDHRCARGDHDAE